VNVAHGEDVHIPIGAIQREILPQGPHPQLAARACQVRWRLATREEARRTGGILAAMLILLAGVGVVLVGLGVLVLLRFPDRPGGSVAFLGMEVSSIGAGLPLIALGVLAVVVTVMQQPADSGTPSGTSGPANQRQPSAGTSGSRTPGEQSGVPTCMAEWFGMPPEVAVERRRFLPRRQGDTIDVLKPSDPKSTEFGLVLKDHGKAIGAAKLRYDGDAHEFPVDGLIDSACKPVAWTTTQNPATPSPAAAVLNDHMHFALGGAKYEMNFDEGEPMTVIGLTAG
jgi:hypothetical protein